MSLFVVVSVEVVDELEVVVDVELDVDVVLVLVLVVEVVLVDVVLVNVVVVDVVRVVVVELGSTIFTSNIMGQMRSIRVLFVSLESSVSFTPRITGTST